MGLTQEKITEINALDLEVDDTEMSYVYVKASDASGDVFDLRVNIVWTCIADAVTAFRKIEVRQLPKNVLDINVSRKTVSVDVENTEVVFSILFDDPTDEHDNPREDVLIGIADK